jgi:hypothetical protein
VTLAVYETENCGAATATKPKPRLGFCQLLSILNNGNVLNVFTNFNGENCF